MKTKQPSLTTSVLAAAELTKHRFVSFDGSHTGNGLKALGSVAAETSIGNIAPVDVSGVILVEAGAAIAAGAEVQSDASARAITKAAGVSNGFAWDAAAQAGDVIRVVRGI